MASEQIRYVPPTEADIARLPPRSRSVIWTALHAEGPKQWNAVETMARMKSRRVLPMLLKLRLHPDADIRGAAVAALAHQRHPLAFRSLLEALEDDNEFVTSEAAKSLDKHRNLRAVRPLFDHWMESEQGNPPDECIIALTQLDCPLTRALFRKALKHPREDIRLDAIESLGVLKDRQAQRALIGLLRRGTPAIRANALAALVKIDAKAHRSQVFRALRDPATEVRNGAIWRLKKQSTNQAYAALTSALGDSDDKNRQSAAEALSEAREKIRKKAEPNPGQIHRFALWHADPSTHPNAYLKLVEALLDPTFKDHVTDWWKLHAQSLRAMDGNAKNA